MGRFRDGLAVTAEAVKRMPYLKDQPEKLEALVLARIS
jgi:hypothetical protein